MVLREPLIFYGVMTMKIIRTIVILSFVLLFMTSCTTKNEINKTVNKDMNYEIATTEVNERTLRYLKFGKGERTLVILPGLSVYYVTDSAQSVVSKFETFTEDFTIYLFDVPDEIPDDYTMDKMISDMKCAIGNFQLYDIYLYGTSMGGMEAIGLAGKYPDLVSGLVVCSSASKNNETSTEILDNWIILAEENDGTGLLKDMSEHIYSETTQKTYGDSLYAGGENLSQETLLRFARITKALVKANVSDEAKNIRCPVLLTGSKGDNVFGYEETIKLAELMNCSYYLYDSTYGHAVYDEADDYLDSVYDFITKN